MKPQKGRPTEDPKTFSARIRLSEKDVEMLAYCCEKTGLSKSEVIRKGIKSVYETIKK